VEHHGGARGEAVEVSEATDRVDQRGDVLDLSIDVIRVWCAMWIGPEADEALIAEPSEALPSSAS
jgi:hypothetical protein